jgi:hypothetical protein
VIRRTEMSEPIEPTESGEWTEDDLKGDDIHPHAPGDDEPEDGEQ